MVQKSPQEYGIDPTAEPLATIDDDHRNAIRVALAKLGMGVDIDRLRRQPVGDEHRLGLLAQVAPMPGVNGHLVRRVLAGRHTRMIATRESAKNAIVADCLLEMTRTVW
jgi:hypothetical protein